MGVEFNEPVMAARAGRQPSFFARVVIGMGLAKTQGGAQAVMLGLTIVLLIAGVFLFLHVTEKPPLPPVEQIAL